MRELFEIVDEYLKLSPLRFHTPLHKGKVAEILDLTARFDVTEVGDFDNLLESSGVLLRLKEKCQEVFSSQLSLLSTSGTTLCNLVMCHALKSFGKIAILRSSHKSIFSAISLFSLDVIIIDDFDEWQMGQTASLKKIEQAFIDGAMSIVITSPSYYGDVADYAEISKLCKKYNAIFAVDEAHGTHLYFGDNLPVAGKFADIVSGSFHKTLPTFTGSAVLNVYHEGLISFVEESYHLLHSTSPQYLSLLSIEYVIDNFENIKRKMSKFVENVVFLKKRLIDSGFTLKSKGDVAKLVIEFCSAQKVAEALERVNVFCEFNDNRDIVFLLSYVDSLEDYDGLVSALVFAKQFDDEVPKFEGKINFSPISFLPYQKALLLPFEEVDINESVGRISFGNFGIYPPCFPLVIYGEYISSEVVELYKSGRAFFGIKNEKVRVLKKKFEE